MAVIHHVKIDGGQLKIDTENVIITVDESNDAFIVGSLVTDTDTFQTNVIGTPRGWFIKL
jgi:hypothetical protein